MQGFTVIWGLTMYTPLELFIDEAAPGHFYRAFIEPGQAGEEPVVLAFSKGPQPTERAVTKARAVAIWQLHPAPRLTAQSPAARKSRVPSI